MAETALADLHDFHSNTGSGLHIAALAGAWTVAVAGFGGMRDHGGRLTFAPRLSAALTRLSFRLLVQGRCLLVDITPVEATYHLLEGDALPTAHHGEELTVAAGAHHPAHPRRPNGGTRHPARQRGPGGADKPLGPTGSPNPTSWPRRAPPGPGRPAGGPP